MKITLLCILLAFAPSAQAQDEKAFTQIIWMLTNNARYKTPALWEGAQRLKAWYSDTISVTRDSVRKADWFMYRALNPLKLGDYDLAFADYEVAVRLNPKNQGQVG